MSSEAGRAHSAPFLLAAALAGLALAWAWMHFAQPLVDTIQVDSLAALACLYYGLIYLPIALLALVMGSICGVRSWCAGERAGRWIAIAFSAGAAGIGLAASLSWLNGGLVSAAQPATLHAGLLFLGAALTLLQIAAEELLFRGWLQGSLRQIFGGKTAIALAALAYAGLSMAGSGFVALPFVNLVLMGLFLGLLAERTGGIAAPVAAHFGWNACEDLVLGLNPNPGAGPFGALWNFDLLGAPLWGGTEAGLAASIGTSAVLAAFILPSLVPRKPV